MRKHFIIFTTLVILLTCILGGCNNEDTSREIGEPVFGNFSATDLSGNPVDQQVFSGKKLTMVNIWGTFCSPCIREMPDLAQLNNAYGEDLQIIGIVIDAADRNGNALPEKKQTALSIIADTGADYLHLLPSPSLYQAYLDSVTAVPETIFVDANGNQIGNRYVGAKSHSQWKSIIEHLLDTLE